MSFCGQVLWNFRTIVSCARLTFGMASAAAPPADAAAAVRNCRRERDPPSPDTPCFLFFGIAEPPCSFDCEYRSAPRVPASYWNDDDNARRSEEHTSELQSLMRISYAVFCLKTKQST